MVPTANTKMFDLEGAFLQGRTPNIYVDLFKADVTPTKNSLYADFTPADFTGYAQAIPTWSGPFLDETGSRYLVSSLFTFTLSALPAQTAFGLVLVDSAIGTAMYMAQRFATPLVLNAAGRTVNFVIKYIIDTQTFVVVLVD